MTTYLASTTLKSFLSITGTDDDDLIEQLVIEANDEVTKRLKPYAESAPLAAGDKYFADARSAAFSFAKVLWYESTSQLELRDSNKKTYEAKIESLTKALIAEPTTRQRQFSVDVTDYDSERKTPYSQVGFAGSLDNLM